MFFSSAIEVIPDKYHELDGYQWLREFKEGEYTELNAKRKQVVHYTSTDIEDKHQHIFNSTNREEIEDWMKKRHEIANYFQNHILTTIEGFYQTLSMLEEIRDDLFPRSEKVAEVE